MRTKHTLDRTAAALGLVALAPLLVGLALLVRVTSPGPALFMQERVSGRRVIRMLKFRTMRPGGDAEPWCSEARVTPLGRWLRRTNLDELPQLWNVLRGEMSLVGPRPERPEYVARFVIEYPGYADRHAVRGGMTGLAQVLGCRGATALEPRIAADLAYIRGRSLAFDLRLILATVL